MNHKVGQVERKTQNRIVEFFKEQLSYYYLGNWEYRGGSNIEIDFLRSFLNRSGYDPTLIDKAISKLNRVAEKQSLRLYDLNKEVYELLRYGVKVRREPGEHTQAVHLIDWGNPGNNHFAIAEEVTIHGRRTKRPDVVIYINGIAIGVIELKRSIVSVAEGVRQNIGNQKDEFIKRFFATVQLVMAGNDTEGLRYGTTETTEDYFLTWKEDAEKETSKLTKHIKQLCNKKRLLEIIHDFMIFDSGIKKIVRHNQYHAVKAAQRFAKDHKSGIIWHTQGSGKSLTMVWLAKWIRENITDARVLVLTDRTELDDQIEGVFKGVDENIYRTKSCQDLVEQLNKKDRWLLCSLIHKFGRGRATGETDVDKFIADVKRSLPQDFQAKCDIFVFIDECHRTQGGKLHEAMKELLPEATFIGFTGTPLLKVDKNNSLIKFGPYIHTYKYDQAVSDKVVLDLRYEARRVDQNITSQEKIDEWFEDRTKGLTDFAKAALKKKWGTMQSLLSSPGRLRKIVFDILDDFYKKDRLASGRGNAMLVASSIHEACRYYEIFQEQGFRKCAVVTSYEPGALNTEDREYRIYQKMLNGANTDDFEREVKKKFVEQPGQMQLLIVVDKLLTGFDAPPATYLYIDKKMQDHGLFQAICRVNRLDTVDKKYGYIIDYRDLFKNLENAVQVYTEGAFEGYDKEDVVGLLKDRMQEGKKDLEEALELVRVLCEPVQPPKSTKEYIDYFCGDTGNPYSVKENEMKRVKLYKAVSHLLYVYADIANDMDAVGFTKEKITKISQEVKHYEQVRQEIKLASGDYIDLKKYEPDMRTLLERYVSAEESEQLSTFDDMSLVELLVKKGEDAIDVLPEHIKMSQEATAETIENNVRRKIIDEMPTNPKYYKQMSELLEDLILRRKKEDSEYRDYLREIVALTKQVNDPETSSHYPATVDSRAKQALYDNLDKNEPTALAVHEAVLSSRSADFRGNPIKERGIKIAIKRVLNNSSEEEIAEIFEIIKNQNEY